MCTPIEPEQSESIIQVLGSIRWLTLKCLILSGGSIDRWCRIWPLAITPRLLSLEIRGDRSMQQEISHASVIFLHQLVSASTLLELVFQNIQLMDRCDWVFVIESSWICS